MCLGAVPACVHLYCVCAVPVEARMVVSHPVGAGKENAHPLQEQLVLLTTQLPVWVQSWSS